MTPSESAHFQRFIRTEQDSRESAASLAMLSVQAVSGDVAVAGLRDSHWIAVGLHVQTNDTVLTGMG